MTFAKYNARTITNRDAYLEELEKVRKLGYAMDNEEELNGVICVGALSLTTQAIHVAPSGYRVPKTG